MRALGICVLLLQAGLAGTALAQTASPLPARMSGQWTAVNPGGRTFIDTISVVLEAAEGTGAVTGRLTTRGVGCGALDEPLTGTWDGLVLRFESRVQPNVNVQRPNGECGSGKVSYALTRKPGQARFDGEAWRDGMQFPVQVTLTP